MTIWKRKPLGAFIIEIIYGFMKAKLFRTQYAKAISKTEYSNSAHNGLELFEYKFNGWS